MNCGVVWYDNGWVSAFKTPQTNLFLPCTAASSCASRLCKCYEFLDGEGVEVEVFLEARGSCPQNRHSRRISGLLSGLDRTSFPKWAWRHLKMRRCATSVVYIKHSEGLELRYHTGEPGGLGGRAGWASRSVWASERRPTRRASASPSARETNGDCIMLAPLTRR